MFSLSILVQLCVQYSTTVQCTSTNQRMGSSMMMSIRVITHQIECVWVVALLADEAPSIRVGFFFGRGSDASTSTKLVINKYK